MYDRKTRIAQLLHEELTRLLREIKDPGLAGLITLTGVTIAGDGKDAIVYYSLLGSRRDRVSTAKALERAAPFMHRQLIQALHLRTVPRLEFRFDETPERAQRVEDILERIHSEEPPPRPEG